MILKINTSALAVNCAMAGICFMFSGIFNLTKYSIGTAGTFVGITLLANMMAMFGRIGVDALENFKYLTLSSLYDYYSILINQSDWLWKLTVALLIALVSFIIGSVVFVKKDLPL
jgi:ABC-2 type transport system permease protein